MQSVYDQIKKLDMTQLKWQRETFIADKLDLQNARARTDMDIKSKQT